MSGAVTTVILVGIIWSLFQETSVPVLPDAAGRREPIRLQNDIMKAMRTKRQSRFRPLVSLLTAVLCLVAFGGAPAASAFGATPLCATPAVPASAKAAATAAPSGSMPATQCCCCCLAPLAEAHVFAAVHQPVPAGCGCALSRAPADAPDVVLTLDTLRRLKSTLDLHSVLAPLAPGVAVPNATDAAGTPVLPPPVLGQPRTAHAGRAPARAPPVFSFTATA
jgi:hypothetical protein